MSVDQPDRHNAPHDLVTCGRPRCLGPHFIRREDIDPGLDAALTAADQPTTEPSDVERVADLLIEHSRYRIEDCYCGWADLGKSHAAHVAQALADAGLLAPAPQPAPDTEREVQCDGGCNYNSGPEEECSLHGRPVAEVWDLLAEATKRADSLDAVVTAVREVAGTLMPLDQHNVLRALDGGAA